MQNVFSETLQRLVQLEEQAKAEGKGKWAPIEEHAKHTRTLRWTVENPRLFVDSHHQKPIEGERNVMIRLKDLDIILKLSIAIELNTCFVRHIRSKNIA